MGPSCGSFFLFCDRSESEQQTIRVGTVYATDAMFFVPSFASITLTHAGRYPWAIAPTINTTKLVATAIATFVSTDKFISPPFVPGVTV